MAIGEYYRIGDQDDSDSRRVVYRIVDNRPGGGDEPIGMMDTPELARTVADALNFLAFAARHAPATTE